MLFTSTFKKYEDLWPAVSRPYPFQMFQWLWPKKTILFPEMWATKKIFTRAAAFFKMDFPEISSLFSFAFFVF